MLHECQEPGSAELVCYQMDLHQAGRVEDELRERNVPGRVVTTADLWDLPAEFQTALYLPARGGERELQDRHGRTGVSHPPPGGLLVVWLLRDRSVLSGAAEETYTLAAATCGTRESHVVLWSPRGTGRAAGMR